MPSFIKKSPRSLRRRSLPESSEVSQSAKSLLCRRKSWIASSDLNGVQADDFASWRAEKILNGAPPAPEEWWTDSDEHFSEGSSEVNTSERSDGSAVSFHNRGCETFEQGRKEWKIRNHSGKRKKLLPVTPFKRDVIIHGLVTTNTEKYDLPIRMSLASMVNVYQDIWEAHGELEVK
eukprot:CAMPEP_0202494220 /NCGR_PEP_ID=MMETSP1361-20130828/11047_1 /ASSEMBLY_ACC=CAM_ASM_000849 /TAXON_ID=210615 /ORGANISM="Staurosira complex sp., Strain CCMP2646" /LENGTH=176 /DNA_ID=CAMNT_0049124647 /DNA_START=17 /DNA_END=547 /DNA_ORIENTATION=+